jgi:hypothetical protein
MYDGADVIETNGGNNFDASDDHSEIFCEIEDEESGRNVAIAIIQGVYFEGINVEDGLVKERDKATYHVT